MDGSASTGSDEDGESGIEEPDEAWVWRHLSVWSLDDGGVEVTVVSLGEVESESEADSGSDSEESQPDSHVDVDEGEDADTNVAHTNAWLLAHASEMKAFEADRRACGETRSTVWRVLPSGLSSDVGVAGWFACRVQLGGAFIHAGDWAECVHRADKVGADTCVPGLVVCVTRACCAKNVFPPWRVFLLPCPLQCTDQAVTDSHCCVDCARGWCGGGGHCAECWLSPEDGLALARVLPHVTLLQHVDISGTCCVGCLVVHFIARAGVSVRVVCRDASSRVLALLHH